MGLDDFITEESVSERNTNSNNSSGATTPEPTSLEECELTFYPPELTSTKVKDGLWEIDQYTKDYVIFSVDYLESVLSNAPITFTDTEVNSSDEILYTATSRKGKYKIRVWSSIKKGNERCTEGLYQRLYVDIVKTETEELLTERKYVTRWKGFEQDLIESIEELLKDKPQ